MKFTAEDEAVIAAKYLTMSYADLGRLVGGRSGPNISQKIRSLRLPSKKKITAQTRTVKSYRAYGSWVGMKERCYNKNAEKWPAYGGSGIKICPRWLKFRNFLEDMGERPIGCSIDRINPFGDYEPSNCRWATPLEQAQTKRRPVIANCLNCGVFCRAQTRRGLCGNCSEYLHRTGGHRPKSRAEIVANIANKLRARCQKPVLQFTLDGKLIAEHPSMVSAARAAGLCGASAISACLRKESKLSGGFLWRIAPPDQAREMGYLT